MSILVDPGAVGLGKMAAKAFKTGSDSYYESTLDKPVPRLIQMLVYDGQEKNCVPNRRPPLLSRSYTRKFTRKLDCSPYCESVCLACTGELSSKRVFSENGANKTKKFHNW